MSIYTTPLSQLGTKDLQELLNDGAVENARLEFKLVDPNKVKTEYADLKSAMRLACVCHPNALKGWG
jgi:hypothetical protein